MDVENTEVDELEKKIPETEAESDDAETSEDEADNDNPASEDEEDGESEEVVVTIGDEEPDEDDENDSEVLRDLRKRYREQSKELKKLRRESEGKEESKKTALGEKPTLADHDYDEESYQSALDDWYSRKAKVDAEEREENKKKEAEEAEWQGRLNTYQDKKQSLQVPDFEDAENEVKNTLSVNQQGILLQGAENPALVVYALGKYPKKAEALAKITDPIKFAFALARMESEMKMQKRKRPKLADGKVSSGTPASPDGNQKKLDRLLEEGMAKGDITEYARYKKQLAEGKS